MRSCQQYFYTCHLDGVLVLPLSTAIFTTHMGISRVMQLLQLIVMMHVCRSAQASLGTLLCPHACVTPLHATPRQIAPTMAFATPPLLLASASLATPDPTVPSPQACATLLPQPPTPLRLATQQTSAAALALSTAMAHAAPQVCPCFSASFLKTVCGPL